MRLLLRLLVVAGLAVDAVVHLDLAATYDQLGGAISQGALFRLEAAAALLAALALLLRPRPWAWWLAAAVAAAGVVAVVLYRYVDVPAIGPIGRMYEPVWYGEKTLSALVEAATVLLAVTGALLPSRRERTVATHHANGG